ncbi:Type IV pilus biogenesis and competence protein PilQ [Zhongshania aliphaticivorans]|uniref:Type IV pilus biogenesis and competence protein PilQ n=1 Tax=Zhongshania aliphaticivorans TaxID=1470434 RepID=A0A5S9N5B0_9GAMM|nr:type IV pilus secretin PilQ family protein [Zhongshania aliphaticivorans]CAA0082667.1 Type IV pilus biogenesis and competence protein PilQ [Zhongshania aliphaticivorans]CAA0084103.1 Type IV pilus biogenesis and competence protein PilQ [Zhongshania aliphaticivorans]
MNTRVQMQSKRPSSQARLGRNFLTAICLLMASAVVAASNLKDIEFNSLQGGSFEARLTFDGPAPEVKGYTIEKPARIALDLVGAGNMLSQKKFPLAYDNASSAVVLEGRDRTRVVLNLIKLASYQTRQEGNAIVVEIGSGGSQAYLKEKYNNPLTSSTKAVSTGNSVTDLDFRRGEKGEGRLVIQLADDKADVNVFVEGAKIKVDFGGVNLPQNLQRRFDVADFATPVKNIDARMGEKGAKLSLEVSGEYDYLAYQTDTEYVVSVKPLTQKEVEDRRREFAYVGEKLSLNFQDIEVRSVLQLIADFTELNLVASDTVRGNITLRLQNVPWDQALELVLKTKGLDKRQVGNVLMVAPAAEIAERERQEIEAQKQVEELAPLQSEFIRVRYADAAELFKLFRPSRGDGQDDENSTGSILSPRGKVIVDERTNSLLITETAERLDEFRRLIALIDVPVRQVQIEARIVRASSDFDRSLGVKWGGAYVKADGDKVYSANGDITSDQATQSNYLSAVAAGSSTYTAVPGLVTDLGVSGAAGSFSLGFISSDVLLNLELSALESKGRGEIVSQPRVVTGDKEPAIIKSGTEIPYPQSSANGETTIAFKEAVLKLDVTPIITPDDRIIMDLTINQDTIGSLVISTGLGGQVPTIDTTELKTRVLVSNGETVVLGGVYDQLDISSETKVPFLGDIPFLGRLFKTTTVSREKQETLIFITPRILADSLVD